VEDGIATADDSEGADTWAGRFFRIDLDKRHYCMITVPAPWRDTSGPMFTW
jgi:hypothetical protein